MRNVKESQESKTAVPSISSKYSKNQPQNLKECERCAYCSKFFHRASLKRHVSVRHSDMVLQELEKEQMPKVADPLKCPLCLRVYKKISKHLQKCKQKYQVICDFCNEPVIKRTMKKHMKDVHREMLTQFGDFECFICHQVMSTLVALQNHVRYLGADHETKRPGEVNTCHECNRTFTKPRDYRIHMENHRQCNQCRMHFINQRYFFF